MVSRKARPILHLPLSRRLHQSGLTNGGLRPPQPSASLRNTRRQRWPLGANYLHNVPAVRNVSFARVLPKLALKLVRIPAMFGAVTVGGLAYLQYQAARQFCLLRCELKDFADELVIDRGRELCCRCVRQGQGHGCGSCRQHLRERERCSRTNEERLGEDEGQHGTSGVAAADFSKRRGGLVVWRRRTRIRTTEAKQSWRDCCCCDWCRFRIWTEPRRG